MDQLTLILIAFLSCFSRALINVIDRWQFAFKKENILHISLLNNIFPMLFSLIGILAFGDFSLFFLKLFTYEACLLGLIIQVVAIIFSNSLKIYPIYQVSLVSKISDFSIPLCIAFLGVKFELVELLLCGISVLICVPLYIKLKIFNSVKNIYFSLILLGLTIQAALAPHLFKAIAGESNILDLIYFCIASLVWRTIWVFLPWLVSFNLSFPITSNTKIIFIRSFLTLICQISFIYVISSGKSIPAILILNLTGFFSIIMANLFMKEKISTEVAGVIFLTFLLSLSSLYVQL